MSGATPAQRLVAAAYVVATTLLSALPRSLVLGAGRVAGDLCHALLPSRRRVALDNLRCAWPELPEPERRRVARESFRHAGAMAADLLTLPAVARDVRRHSESRPGDVERLRELSARGKGVILVAGHFGLMEAMGIFLGASGMPVSFVAKPFDNPALDAAIERRRGATGNRTIHKGGAKPAILETLAAGGRVAIVADQHATTRKRLWIPFFGLDAATARSIGTLAIEAGAPVACIHNFPLPGGRSRFELGPVIEPAGRTAEEIVRAAIADLEAATRRAPGCWLWMHRRWKVCRDEDRAKYPAYTWTESQERRHVEERERLRGGSRADASLVSE